MKKPFWIILTYVLFLIACALFNLWITPKFIAQYDLKSSVINLEELGRVINEVIKIYTLILLLFTIILIYLHRKIIEHRRTIKILILITVILFIIFCTQIIL